METFYLEILSPTRTFYAGECVSLSMPISDGMIGIMAHHSPLCAAIEDGEINFTLPDGEKVICAVTRGMADFTDNRAEILCESAVALNEIDEEKEARRLEEAKHELNKKQSEKEYALWRLSFNKAVNRLKVKNKHLSLTI
ncbi:MAG: ATP synthase F1 subunit epsilon [Clostridia bacterium]|nr:ATP synthase F1 subunit epsilon [Clostridia bacterium]